MGRTSYPRVFEGMLRLRHMVLYFAPPGRGVVKGRSRWGAPHFLSYVRGACLMALYGVFICGLVVMGCRLCKEATAAGREEQTSMRSTLLSCPYAAQIVVEHLHAYATPLIVAPHQRSAIHTSEGPFAGTNWKFNVPHRLRYKAVCYMAYFSIHFVRLAAHRKRATLGGECSFKVSRSTHAMLRCRQDAGKKTTQNHENRPGSTITLCHKSANQAHRGR